MLPCHQKRNGILVFCQLVGQEPVGYLITLVILMAFYIRGNGFKEFLGEQFFIHNKNRKHAG